MIKQFAIEWLQSWIDKYPPSAFAGGSKVCRRLS